MKFLYSFAVCLHFCNASFRTNTGISAGGGDNDGLAGSKVAKDVVSYVLSYNANDYKSIGDGSSPSTQLVQGLGSSYKPLYNGNIAAMGVSLSKLNQPMVYNYSYDVLNRMIAMDAFTSSAGWGNLQATVNNAYGERVSYDPNGNIKSYQRNGTSALAAMDDLHYNYYALTNQLSQITDPTPVGNYPNDIDGQSATNYYQYDPSGNLVQEGDNATGNTITWNVYGKIQQVHKSSDNSNIIYTYDALGNRISKINNNTTYYVRDGSGIVIAVYEGTSTQMKVTETNLYGNTRLGLAGTQTVATAEQTLSGFGVVRTFTFTRGEKSYELSNHLGNVLSTISDRRQQMPNNSTVSYYIAEVTSATDYYPFGMQMPGRTISSSSYRYGFNGKENDNDIKGDGNQLDFGERIYDPRTGRWMSVDPLTSQYPHQSPYASMSNDPINRIDPNGMGDYYTKEGKRLGSDGKTVTQGKGKNARQVSDDKAYVAESVTLGTNGLVTSAVNSQELSMSNTELGQFAKMIFDEGWGNGNQQEAYSIASATVNYTNYMKDHGVDISIIVAASKISSAWSGKTKYDNARYSMGAAINAITGGTDYSGGEIKWDGGDLGTRGFSHIKPRTSGVEISESLFSAFKGAWPDKDLQAFWGDNTSTFSNNFTSGIHLATEGTFKGICAYKATAVHGHTLFWGVNKDPIVSKTIWVSPFKVSGYSNPSVGLEDFPIPITTNEHPNSKMTAVDWKNVYRVK